MERFKKKKKAEIAIAARKVFENHLQYLSDELVGLALFSNRVSAKDKDQIVAGLKKIKASRNVREPGKLNTLNNYISLRDFATEKTTELFSHFNISDFFLQLSPEVWEESSSYRIGREKVKGIKLLTILLR